MTLAEVKNRISSELETILAATDGHDADRTAPILTEALTAVKSYLDRRLGPYAVCKRLRLVANRALVMDAKEAGE